MSCLLRAAGCCGYANGMLSLVYFWHFEKHNFALGMCLGINLDC